MSAARARSSAAAPRPGSRRSARWARRCAAGHAPSSWSCPSVTARRSSALARSKSPPTSAGAEACLYLTPNRCAADAGVRRRREGPRCHREHPADPQDRSPKTPRPGAHARPAARTSSSPRYQQVAAAPGATSGSARPAASISSATKRTTSASGATGRRRIGSLRRESTLMLSATPVRLDRDAIAGARYVEEEDGGPRHRPAGPRLDAPGMEGGPHPQAPEHADEGLRGPAARRPMARSTSSPPRRWPSCPTSTSAACASSCAGTRTTSSRWCASSPSPCRRRWRPRRASTRDWCSPRPPSTPTTSTACSARWHPSLRCAVVHSGDIGDAENERRLRDFHARQVRRAHPGAKGERGLRCAGGKRAAEAGRGLQPRAGHPAARPRTALQPRATRSSKTSSTSSSAATRAWARSSSTSSANCRRASLQRNAEAPRSKRRRTRAGRRLTRSEADDESRAPPRSSTWWKRAMPTSTTPAASSRGSS